MSIEIRDAVEEDAAQLVELRRRIFAETAFMLLEPAEFTATAEQERQSIRRMSERTNSRLLVAALESALIGFVAAMGGERNRQRHAALIVLGVARDHWSKGIGARLLGEIVAWAPAAGLKRVELTVHTTNARAIALYRKCGFEVEGTRQCSLLVDGQYVDEYLMSFITPI
jgi:RimJ/RimL family protein N-acetyltransferase